MGVKENSALCYAAGWMRSVRLRSAVHILGLQDGHPTHSPGPGRDGNWGALRTAVHLGSNETGLRVFK